MAMKAQENVLAIEGSARVIARQDGRLGSILVEEGKLGAGGIERVLELQRIEGLRFGEAALRLNLVTADDLRCAVAKQYGFPYLPPGEGRSYVAANLAVVFSQLGERTLLIDADLRAPRQHRIFNVPDRIGLSAVLSGRADRGAVVPIPECGTLSLLPAGACPPNPQELLLRPAFATLLEELRTEFDVILFDTPPAKFYADAQSLAFRAGSVMVLARKDHTRFADTAGVIRELSDTGARIVGTVFNAF